MTYQNKVLTRQEISDVVVPLLSSHRMNSASLFGSYARGEADETSDIDILLEGKEGFRARDVFSFAEHLHRATGKNVDVYEISEIVPGKFRDTIMSEKVAL